MPYRKTNKNSNRDDTFFAVGKLYEIILTQGKIYKDSSIEELELTEYRFETAIKSIRNLISIEYPYGFLVFIPKQRKYVLVI